MEQQQIDADIDATAPTTVMRVCAGVMGTAGFLGVLTGGQSLAMARGDLVVPFGAALVCLGLAGMVTAWYTGLARGWAAIAGVVVELLLLCTAAGWMLYSLSSGMFSCIAVIAVGLSVFGIGGAGGAIGPCMKASRARARLQAQGMQLGI